MADKPIPGTWGAIRRSTEEEHKVFRAALNKLFFTKDEFIAEGPSVIFRKYDECMKVLKDNAQIGDFNDRNKMEHQGEESEMPTVQEGDSDR